jgi:hypothetical protein
MAPFAEWWRRRSLKARIGLSALAVFVGLAILGALLPSNDDGQGKQASPPPPATQAAPPPPPPRPPPPPLVPKTTRPILLYGRGAKVKTIRLTADGPIVVNARHRGFSNFALEFVGANGSELLVNEIGNYKGEVAYADALAGRYRLKISADGYWGIIISQPFPQQGGPRARPVPGTFSGRGSHVVRIRAEDDLQPVVTVQHRGRSNFVVELIGYGDTSGNELLINEIGNYSGQTLVNDMPAGSYLLSVQADGRWKVRFSP